MQPEVLELVDLDPHVVHDPETADTLHQLLSFERMGRTRHDVHLHTAARRADQALDDQHILKALVLHEQGVPGLVDEAGKPIAPRPGTPDQLTPLARRERSPVPVGLEAFDDLSHLVAAGRDDGVVTRLGHVLRRPVERRDERRVIVHHHRFLVRQIEGRIGVVHVDARSLQRLARGLVVLLATAAGRVEHHADLHAAPLRRQDRLEQRRVREDEHLDAQRPRRAMYRREDRRDGVIREDDQRAAHADAPPVGSVECDADDPTGETLVQYKSA